MQKRKVAKEKILGFFCGAEPRKKPKILFSSFSYKRKKNIFLSFLKDFKAASGLEPLNGGFADLSLATWVRRQTRTRRISSACGLLTNGAGDGIRTRDPNLGKVVLYQLSYTREKRSGKDKDYYPNFREKNQAARAIVYTFGNPVWDIIKF